MDEVQEPSAELIERIRNKFCAVGLRAVAGG
jgi:hypothetical protein